MGIHACQAFGNIFFQVHFVHGYWQFPHAESWGERLVALYGFAFLISNPVLHGAASLVSLLLLSRNDILIRLYDMLVYALDCEHHVVAL